MTSPAPREAEASPDGLPMEGRHVEAKPGFACTWTPQLPVVSGGFWVFKSFQKPLVGGVLVGISGVFVDLDRLIRL